MSFIELFNFIIYQHLNKRVKILPLATCKKMQNFQSLGAPPPRPSRLQRLKASFPNPQPSAAGGFAPRSHWPLAAPKQPPPHCKFLAMRLFANVIILTPTFCFICYAFSDTVHNINNKPLSSSLKSSANHQQKYIKDNPTYPTSLHEEQCTLNRNLKIRTLLLHDENN